MKNQDQILSNQNIPLSNPFTQPYQNLFTSIFQPKPNPFNQGVNHAHRDVTSDIFASLNLHCKCNQPVALYCCSENCIESAIICSDFRSQCMTLHKRCPTTMIADHFHSRINQNVKKLANGKKILGKIQDIVDKMTDEVSEMVTKFEEKLKLFGLNANEFEIIEKLSHISKESKEQQKYILKTTEKMNIFLGGNESTKVLGSTFFKFAQKQKRIQKRADEDSIEVYQTIVTQTKSKINKMFQDIADNLNSLIQNKCFNESSSMGLSCLLVKSSMYSYHRDYENKFKLSMELNVIEQIMKNNKLEIASLQKVFSYQTPKYNVSNQQDDNFLVGCLMHAIKGKSNLLFLAEVSNDKRVGCFVPFAVQTQNIIDKYEDFQRPLIFDLQREFMQIIDPIYNREKMSESGQIIEIGDSQNPDLTSGYFQISIPKDRDVKVGMQMSAKAFNAKENMLAKNNIFSKDQNNRQLSKVNKSEKQENVPTVMGFDLTQALYFEIFEVKLMKPDTEGHLANNMFAVPISKQNQTSNFLPNIDEKFRQKRDQELEMLRRSRRNQDRI